MVFDFDSFLLIAAGLSIIGGIVFGLYYNHVISLISKRKKDRNQSQNSKFKEEERVGKEQKINSNLIKNNLPLLEDEIKIYQFEKDLVSHAIHDILAASKNKSIDTFEKDRLLLRYNNQVKQLNEKMEKIQSEIDVTKLIDLRNDLVSLLDNKISAIDEKIKEIKFKIGTNYKILEIKNQNKQNNNTNNNNNNVNHTNPSLGIEETIDVNLNARKVINYKNTDTNKKKDRVIDAERKKIGDLKDQVLVALNRLDRSEDIKQEIENEVATTINDSENRKDLTKEESKNFPQNTYEFNDKDHLHIENKNTLNTAIKNNVTAPPAIFSFLQGIQSKNDIITTKAISNPSYERETTSTKSIIKNDESQNKIKEENSFINVHQIKNNKYNNNKSNPLSNILNHTELKFDPYMKIKEEEEKDIVEIQIRDKQDRKNDSHSRFKFPLSFIFSKSNKEKTTNESKMYDTDSKRRDSLSNILNKDN
ncbi:MAG TPA: hypothetical protein VF242_00435 [Nitrososphaeraceae archaeon]